jgi:hypothetical protein
MCPSIWREFSGREAAQRLHHRAAVVAAWLGGKAMDVRLWLGFSDDSQRAVKSFAGTVKRATDIEGQGRLKPLGGALGGPQGD